MLGLGSHRLRSCLSLRLASKHGLNGLFHLAAKISQLSFDRHCSILIFIGDQTQEDYSCTIIVMLTAAISMPKQHTDDAIQIVIRMALNAQSNSLHSIHVISFCVQIRFNLASS